MDEQKNDGGKLIALVCIAAIVFALCNPTAFVVSFGVAYSKDIVTQAVDGISNLVEWITNDRKGTEEELMKDINIKYEKVLRQESKKFLKTVNSEFSCGFTVGEEVDATIENASSSEEVSEDEHFHGFMYENDACRVEYKVFPDSVDSIRTLYLSYGYAVNSTLAQGFDVTDETNNDPYIDKYLDNGCDKKDIETADGYENQECLVYNYQKLDVEEFPKRIKFFVAETSDKDDLEIEVEEFEKKEELYCLVDDRAADGVGFNDCVKNYQTLYKDDFTLQSYVDMGEGIIYVGDRVHTMERAVITGGKLVIGYDISEYHADELDGLRERTVKKMQENGTDAFTASSYVDEILKSNFLLYLAMNDINEEDLRTVYDELGIELDPTGSGLLYETVDVHPDIGYLGMVEGRLNGGEYMSTWQGEGLPYWGTMIPVPPGGFGASLGYCTGMVMSRFYSTYGKTVTGVDGANQAQQVVNQYPSEFRLSKTPAPGAVGSRKGTKENPYGHTFWVEEVGEDYIIISEGGWGAVDNAGKLHPGGFNVNLRMSYADFYARFPASSTEYAVHI